MSGEQGDVPQTQFERTELAWRRTLVVVLAVVGLGGIKLVTDRLGHQLLGVFAGVVAVATVMPIWARIRRLRRRDESAATWEPLALTAAVLVLAAALTLVS